jgi:hypothetical protein
LRLKENAALSLPSQLMQNEFAVMASSDHNPTLRARESIRPGDGVLEERAGPGKSTVLLGLVIAEPFLDEGPRSLSFTSG